MWRFRHNAPHRSGLQGSGSSRPASRCGASRAFTVKRTDPTRAVSLCAGLGSRIDATVGAARGEAVGDKARARAADRPSSFFFAWMQGPTRRPARHRRAGGRATSRDGAAPESWRPASLTAGLALSPERQALKIVRRPLSAPAERPATYFERDCHRCGAQRQLEPSADTLIASPLRAGEAAAVWSPLAPSLRSRPVPLSSDARAPARRNRSRSRLCEQTQGGKL
jgi:hypothetical protein